MANIIFYLRGNKEPKKIYLRYRPNRDFNLSISTPFSILSDNWNDKSKEWDTSKIIKGAKTTETKKHNAEIANFNKRLNAFKLEISNLIDDNLNLSSLELKDFLKKYILINYFGHKIDADKKYTIPIKFDSLIDYYIQYRSIEDKTQNKKPISENTIKKYKGLKNTLHKFDRQLKVTDINNAFRNKFVEWLNKQSYSVQTQTKYLKDIKMLCRFSETEHNISKEVLNWKINRNPDNITKGLYFSFIQLSILENLPLTGSLDNARDWLIISCYTALRVSELLSLDVNNIIEVDKRKYIKVIERKNINTATGGVKYTPLIPKILKIMDKRGGKFPEAVSEQYYNRQIKKVCKIAGFDKMVESAKTKNTGNGNRRIEGKYPFYDLVTSHIGRQTAVTLFSQYIAPETLQLMTNHQSMEMLNHYNKTDIDTRQQQKAIKLYQALEDIEFNPNQLN
ncbi:tyrosine-type recombinase/integrase [Riemerella columbipharyngis]|uniref:Site-specific recombinase XerD n=1 Tax=Riemerella columbipharyngis TaxID=1071918 RepID=A0A1G7DC37_9FLAO|nr:phage integrase SAM-like domain-containing protein [Riemerella columbipharyngis]SDE48540.1 Site-specific recombinase XerD [Riemerella columbipharyngis]